MSAHVVALLGPTASGKTAIAVEVARRMPIEVVSADSRQIRREMHIGTAAPTDDELSAVPHHLVGVTAPDAPWTLADFLGGARAAIDEIHERGRTPLLLGGTGQYIWALLEGWEVPAVEPNADLRVRLERDADSDGAEALHARLASLDPASADRIDARNVRRVIRALEIIDATGEPVPPLNRRGPDFSWSAVGVRWERSELHQRADARAQEMYASGLIEETRALVTRYGSEFGALRSIGYAEARQVIGGELTEAEALDRTKIETHRLIRMQATWFAADDQRIEWFDAAESGAVAAAVVAAAHAPVR